MQHQAVKSIDKDTGSNGIIMKDVEVKSMGLYFSILKRTLRPLPRRRPRPPTLLRHPQLPTTKTEAITIPSTSIMPSSSRTNCSSKMFSRDGFHQKNFIVVEILVSYPSIISRGECRSSYILFACVTWQGN